MYASARLLLDQGFATPVDGEADLEHLPDVVPDAALDPPERIPGALDVVIARSTSDGGGGVDWQSPPVALGIVVVGSVPAVFVRRRLLARQGR
jgi:hypothetical protein